MINTTPVTKESINYSTLKDKHNTTSKKVESPFPTSTTSNTPTRATSTIHIANIQDYVTPKAPEEKDHFNYDQDSESLTPPQQDTSTKRKIGIKLSL